MDREEALARKIYPHMLLRGDIQDQFVEDELRLIYESLFMRQVFAGANISSDLRVFHAAQRSGYGVTSIELAAGKVKAKKGATLVLPFQPPGQLKWTTLAFHPQETLENDSWKSGPEYGKEHLRVCWLKYGPAHDRDGYRDHEETYGCASKIKHLAKHPALLVSES